MRGGGAAGGEVVVLVLLVGRRRGAGGGGVGGGGLATTQLVHALGVCRGAYPPSCIIMPLPLPWPLHAGVRHVLARPMN